MATIMDFRAGRRRGRMPSAAVKRDTPLTLSEQATIYGCCGVFDLCNDADLMSLSFADQEPFLDWIGWQRTDQCMIKRSFIAWQRPARNGNNPTVGYLSGPCEPANGTEWGICDFTLDGFGSLGRAGPVRNLTQLGLKLCDTQPRYRLNGTQIIDDREYDARVATEVMLSDLKQHVIDGDKTTPGLFDGLERLVRYGYESSNGVKCQLLDSNVIDWNGNDMDGGAGITWNGVAQPTTANFIDFLMAAYRRVRQRIRWSPILAAQQLQVGDIALVMPESFIDCLLNFYTCWRVCPGQEFNENNLQSLEARTFRNSLNGGMFGAGRIFLHGFEIPILPYDWGLIKSDSTFDAYLLVGQVGSVKTLQGQFNDMTSPATVRPDRFEVSDGGRLLIYSKDDERCEQRTVYMEPRLLSWTPWANTRFIDVSCDVLGGPLSPDPDSEFFPQTSFSAATCP